MHKDKNIFYNTDNLALKSKKSLLQECKDLSYHWLPNVLDCSKSYSRQYYDATFEEMLDMLKEDTHFVVIDRGTWGDATLQNREHFEIGFRTMDKAVDYFLFVQVDSDKMPPILEKYELVPR